MYQVDNQSRVPAYEQIVLQIEKYILTGILAAGDQLPSVRAMSLQLHVNPNTVQKAYTELDRRGLIFTTLGKGAFVSEEATDILKREKRSEMPKLVDQIREIAMTGIEKQELIEIIEKVYEEEKND